MATSNTPVSTVKKKVKMPNKVTAFRQLLFVHEYLKDLNGKQAAIRAGVELTTYRKYIDKCYVYFLVCPNDKDVYYVGKGTRDRVLHHAQQSRKSVIRNSEKHRRLVNCEHQPEEYIFASGLTSDEALSLENELIRGLGIENLTNIASYQNDYIQRSIDQLNGWLDKEETAEEWEERFILIRGREPSEFERKCFSLVWSKTKELLHEYQQPGWTPYVT